MAKNRAIELYFSTQVDTVTQPQLTIEYHGHRINEALEATNIRTLRKNVMVWKANVQLLTESPVSYIQISILNDSRSQTLINTIYRLPTSENKLYLYFDSKIRMTGFSSEVGLLDDSMYSVKQWHVTKFLYVFVISILFIFAVTFVTRGKPFKNRDIPNWFSPIFFFIISILWQGTTFFDFNSIVGRHHDTIGTYWVANRSPFWENFFIDSRTGFPNEFTDYRDVDSLLLVLVGKLLFFLPTHIVLKIFTVLSLTFSAWAAELWARDLNVKQPWSYVAGLGFVYVGLSANALLEGHIYQICLLWLPLCGLFWWKTNRHSGSIRDALLSGLFFSLCLFNSSYIGLSCVILLLGIWIGHKGWNNPKTFYALLTATPFLLIYLYLFSSSNMLRERDYFATLLGSTSLLNFWGAHSEIDRQGHSLSLGILLIPLLLAACSNRYLHKQTGYRILVFTGIASLILSFGPSLTVTASSNIIYLPLQFLMQLPVLKAIGFPLRLATTFFLCVSLVAAITLQHLVQKNRIFALLLPIVIIEILSNSLQSRQELWSRDTPDISPTGPVFEFFPEIPNQLKKSDHQLHFIMMSCLHQTKHQMPIPFDCVSTEIDKMTYLQYLNQTYRRFSKGEEALSELYEIGFREFIIYPELFSVGDRDYILEMIEKEATLVEEVNHPILTKRYEYTPSNNSRTKTQDTERPQITKEIIFELIPFSFYPNEIILSYNNKTYTFDKTQTSSVLKYVGTVPNFQSGDFVQFKDLDNNVLWQGKIHISKSHDKVKIELSSGVQYYLLSVDISPIQLQNNRLVFLGWMFFLIVVRFLWTPKKSRNEISPLSRQTQ